MLVREITAGLVLWGVSLAVLSSCRLNLSAVRNTSTTILRAPTNQKAGSRFGVIRPFLSIEKLPGKCRPLRTGKTNGLILLTRLRLS